MVTCKRCGGQLPDTASFCGLCGYGAHAADDSTTIATEENRYPSIHTTVPYHNKEDRDKDSFALIPPPPPPLPSEYLPSPTREGQSGLHGSHQQPGLEHGMHQQPGFERGMHQQPGLFEHDIHQQRYADRAYARQTKLASNSRFASLIPAAVITAAITALIAVTLVVAY